jgi:serine/threonine protein kinase
MTPESDQALSHYRLIEKIDSGGMGVVWKAQDMVLSRTVAIKVLPADVSMDENRRRMFLEEARPASPVSDARIAQVYDFGRTTFFERRNPAIAPVTEPRTPR